MIICDKDKCTGCGCCINVCPNNCIYMKYDECGISHPEIDEGCTNCGLCKRACPTNNIVDKHESMNAYVAWDLDVDSHKRSASGGIAHIFYKYMINDGGYVCGTSYDDNLQLVYSITDNLDDIEKYRGSKYSQSSTGYIFRDIKKLLVNDNKVLFIGTPCQVDGLKKFLGKEYYNLITVDLICHGMPSQKYIDDHIKHICRKKGKLPDRLTFRGERDFRFSLYKNGDVIYSGMRNLDNYLAGFLKGLFYRDSCYQCKYANSSRVSDITIGDFWGLGRNKPFEHSKENGVSVVLINTEKGMNYFNKCKSGIFYEERDLKEAIEGNAQLKHPSIKHNKYDYFMKQYQKIGFEKASSKSLFRDKVIYLRMKIISKLKKQ